MFRRSLTRANGPRSHGTASYRQTTSRTTLKTPVRPSSESTTSLTTSLAFVHLTQMEKKREDRSSRGGPLCRRFVAHRQHAVAPIYSALPRPLASSPRIFLRERYPPSSSPRVLPPFPSSLPHVLPAGIPSVVRFSSSSLLFPFSSSPSSPLAYLNLNVATLRASSLLLFPCIFSNFLHPALFVSCSNMVLFSSVRHVSSFLPSNRLISLAFRSFVRFLFFDSFQFRFAYSAFHSALFSLFFPLCTACSAVRSFRSLSLLSHSLLLYLSLFSSFYFPSEFPLSHLSATRGSPLACTRAKVCLSLLVVSWDCNARPRNQRVQTAIALSRYSLFVTAAT